MDSRAPQRPREHHAPYVPPYRPPQDICQNNNNMPRDNMIILTLEPLVSTPKAILSIKHQIHLPPPLPLIETPKREILHRYCDYHEEKGHNLNDCEQLKKQLELALESSKLNQLVKDVRQKGKGGKSKSCGNSHSNCGVIGERRYGVSVLALTKDHRGIKINTPYPEGINTSYSRYGINIIFWKISSVVPTPRNPQYVVSNTWIHRDLDNSTSNVLIPLDSWTSGLLVYKLPLSVRMTKVIKGEFEKIKDVKVIDVPLTCDASLEVFNDEVSRLSKMDDDLFTYEVEVANIPCDSKMDNDLEQEADDDMGYDPSDVAFIEWLGSKIFNYKTMDHSTMKALWIYWIIGDDEVELTDEESSNDEDDIAKVFRIDTNIFDYETPLCSAFKEFNYLLEVDPDLLTKDIIGFKTYEDYKDDWIYEWNKDIPWVDENPRTDAGVWTKPTPDYEWYEALENCKLKDEALRNKAIMEGYIKEDDDESHYEQKRQWNTYTNYDDAYEINHEHNKSKELCEVHEQPVCNIRRYMMIKYSFNDDEEYVAVKEDEYDDLTVTRKEACRALLRNLSDYGRRMDGD
ncbi:hypothetical protein Tco_1101700 [Tanacetum coccineum]